MRKPNRAAKGNGIQAPASIAPILVEVHVFAVFGLNRLLHVFRLPQNFDGLEQRVASEF